MEAANQHPSAQEQSVHFYTSDDGTQAYTTEDASSENEANRKRAKHRWYEYTKPERDLIKQIKAARRKDMSRILYRAYLIEQSRKREIIQRREEQTAQDDQSTPIKKNKKSKGGLRSRDFITAWPIRPRGSHRENLRRLLRLASAPSQKRVPNRAFIDPSGTRSNAIPDQQDTASSSDDDEDQVDRRVLGPAAIAALNKIIYTYKAEPDSRPSAQVEEILIARLMKVSKDKFRKRSRTDGFDVSADDRLMTTQLRPLARNLIGCLNSFLHGMDQQAFGRGKRRLHYNDWETVLMMASQQGWPKEVLQRASARCNAIFKQGTRSDKSLSTINEPESRQDRIESTPAMTQTQHLCPVKTCARHRVPFALIHNLKEHVDSNHANQAK